MKNISLVFASLLGLTISSLHTMEYTLSKNRQTISTSENSNLMLLPKSLTNDIILRTSKNPNKIVNETELKSIFNKLTIKMTDNETTLDLRELKSAFNSATKKKLHKASHALKNSELIIDLLIKSYRDLTKEFAEAKANLLITQETVANKNKETNKKIERIIFATAIASSAITTAVIYTAPLVHKFFNNK